jgi:hypothetical protein
VKREIEVIEAMRRCLAALFAIRQPARRELLEGLRVGAEQREIAELQTFTHPSCHLQRRHAIANLF